MLIEIGWREWVDFPLWAVNHIKAKVDSGARTSSLHADNLEFFKKDGKDMVRFVVQPWQRSTKDPVNVEMPVHAMREIRSSSGQAEKRPVIITKIKVAEKIYDAEITLTNRDLMGFRMLLGRELLRGRFLINPGQSYLGGRPPKAIRDRNRGRAS
jgi:hypothetical protein